MHRCSSGFFLSLTLALLITLAGCAGKSSSTGSNSAVQSVTLTPTGNISLDLGSTNQTFTATARNGIGQVIPVNFQFVSSNNASLTVANTGQACAGTWDSLTNPVVCTPGVSGVAQVTAVVGGISSAPATVYVHQHIDNITLAPTSPPPSDCFSLGDPDPQNRTAIFQATAYSNGVDITNSVGPISFSPTVANVLTIDTNNQLPNNQVQVTAKTPGVTNLIASVAGSNSTPYIYTTCLVSQVVLQIQNGSGNTINFTSGGTQTIQATVFDTHNNILSNPPLTWGSTNPEVASVTATSTNGTTTVSAKSNLGGADVFGACEPPTCNIGVLPGLPIYSTDGIVPPPNNNPAFGAITVNVTNSKVPTYTAWAATTGCGTALNCSSAAFPVTPGNNPIGAGVTLPRTPNSMMFTPAGDRLYFGSDQGLMFVSPGGTPSVTLVSSASSPCNVIVCGKVLAISGDGNRVVVSDTISNPNQVYIYSSNGIVDLLIPGASSAVFSPDGFKLFIVTNTGALYVYSTVDALGQFTVQGSPTDVAFSADGSFAYISGTPTASNVSAYSVCSTLQNAPFNVLTYSSPNIVAPLKLSPLADLQFDLLGRQAQTVVALDPPNIDLFTVGFHQNPPTTTGNPPQHVCQPPTVVSDEVDFPTDSFNLGQGTFTPLYYQLSGGNGPFGAQVDVVAQNVPAVLVFDVNQKTTTPFQLFHSASPTAASASPDGSQIFVASCDADHPQSQFSCGSIHIVNTLSGGDVQQAVYTNPNTKDSMCAGLDPNGPPCIPNLIAVKPQ